MNMSSPIWCIASLGDLHWQLIIKLIIFFQQGNDKLLEGINWIIMIVIGDTRKMYIKWVFTKHCYQYDVLEKVGNIS